MLRAALASVLAFLKGSLVRLRATPPTPEDTAAFEAYEDETGSWGQYPSPAERFADAVEWRDSMLELSLWTLLRWRVSIAWMPFCSGETRLVGERISRWLYPDLYGLRRKKALAKKGVRA